MNPMTATHNTQPVRVTAPQVAQPYGDAQQQAAHFRVLLKRMPNTVAEMLEAERREQGRAHSRNDEAAR